MGTNNKKPFAFCNTLQLLTVTIFLTSPPEMSGVSSKQAEKDGGLKQVTQKGREVWWLKDIGVWCVLPYFTPFTKILWLGMNMGGVCAVYKLRVHCFFANSEQSVAGPMLAGKGKTAAPVQAPPALKTAGALAIPWSLPSSCLLPSIPYTEAGEHFPKCHLSSSSPSLLKTNWGLHRTALRPNFLT